jgi:hypothetical protein
MLFARLALVQPALFVEEHVEPRCLLIELIELQMALACPRRGVPAQRVREGIGIGLGLDGLMGQLPAALLRPRVVRRVAGAPRRTLEGLVLVRQVPLVALRAAEQRSKGFPGVRSPPRRALPALRRSLT